MEIAGRLSNGVVTKMDKNHYNGPEVGGRVNQCCNQYRDILFLSGWPVLCSCPNLHGSVLIFE